MPYNNLTSLQSWFSSELDFLGIDSAIYSRHVLNLFLNADYMMDYRLAEKEANIFANLCGIRKRNPKKKYRKRSNSFTHSDENIWKKQMAVNFLMTAVDDDTMDTTRDCIESLINKLDGQLHRISGTSSASENRSIRSEKRKQRTNERYQDAFPLLGGLQHDPNKPMQTSANIWTNSKSAQEVKEVEKINKINRHRRGLRKKQNSTSDRSAKNPKHFKPYDLPKESGGGSPRKTTFRRKRGGSASVGEGIRRGTRKRSSSAAGKTHHCLQDRNSSSNSGSNSRKKNPTSAATGGPQSCWVHSDLFAPAAPPPPGFSADDMMSAYAATLDQNNNNGGCRGQCVFYPVDDKENSSPVHFQFPGSSHCRSSSIEENCISHLYSVDASCLDIPYSSNVAPQSKWFRNPESGFLEFEPGYKRSTSQTSSSDNEDFGFASGEQSDSENWLWCPSPSLWEDKSEDSCNGGAVSRLETIYRSASSPSIEDELTARLWESYKAIFTGIINPPNNITTTTTAATDYENGQPDTDFDGYTELDLLDDIQFLNNELSNLPVSLIEEINADTSDLNGNFLYDQLVNTPLFDFSEPVTPKAKLHASSSFDVSPEQPVYCLFKSHSDSDLDFAQHCSKERKPADLKHHLPSFSISPASLCVESELAEAQTNKEIEDLNLAEAVPPLDYKYENPPEAPSSTKTTNTTTAGHHKEPHEAFAGGDSNSNLVELSTDAFLSSLYDGDLMDLETIMNLSKIFQPTTTATSSSVVTNPGKDNPAAAGSSGKLQPNKKKCSRNPKMENYHGLDDFITEISESIFANMCWMFDWDLSPCIDKRDSFAQYWRPKTREPMYSFKGSDYGGGEFPTLLPDEKNSGGEDADDLYYMSMLALSVVESVVDMADRNGSKEGSPVPSCLLTGFPATPGKRKFPSGGHSSSSRGKLKEKKKMNHRLDECITDNDAWKTSLRIGNMWQAISGIRPVDIIYSEKQNKAVDDSAVPQPSSLTHFRPIRPSESSNDTSASSSYQEQYIPPVDDCFEASSEGTVVNSMQDLTVNYGLQHFTDSYPDVYCDVPLQGLEHEIGNLLGDTLPASTVAGVGHQSLETSFSLNSMDVTGPHATAAYGKNLDKCLQTTFEQQIRMIDRDVCDQLSIRPPKANSR